MALGSMMTSAECTRVLGHGDEYSGWLSWKAGCREGCCCG
jgi:hypothetical protein